VTIEKCALYRETNVLIPTYAFGDIHGCLDQLQRLVELCERDAGAQELKFIFLGDYIDRGPDSRGVVEFLIDLQTWSPDDIVCLLGNHEAMLLAAIDDEANEPHWLRNGGNETLYSYRTPSPVDIPRKHMEWLFVDLLDKPLARLGRQPDLVVERHDKITEENGPYLANDACAGRRYLGTRHSSVDESFPARRKCRIHHARPIFEGSPAHAAAENIRRGGRRCRKEERFSGIGLAPQHEGRRLRGSN
jgi:hypothetical protein